LKNTVIIILFGITCFIIEFKVSANGLSPRTANYQMNITLDVEQKMLNGKTVLNWNNPSGDTIKNLPFQQSIQKIIIGDGVQLKALEIVKVMT